MARSGFYYGNEMMLYDGTPSGYYFSEDHWDQTSIQRVKPKDLISNPTSLVASRNEIRSQLVTLPLYGPELNPWPIQMFGAVNANLNDPRYAGALRSAHDAAATKLRMRLKDQTWNAAQTAAEFRKTLQFVTSASRDLVSAYRLFRKGDIAGLSNFYRQYDYRGRRRKPPDARAGDRWLQWRYAVMPLAYDTQDMLEELYRSDIRPSVQRFGGRQVVALGGVYAEGQVQGQPTWYDFELTYSARYTTYVRLNPDLISWKRLGLVNVPALLWELSPGSFLLDWWLPVGTYLSGLDATYGVEEVSTTFATKGSLRESYHQNGAEMTATSRDYSRIVSGIPSQPVPRLRTSDYDLKNRCLDALALLRNVVDSRSR